MRVVQRVELTRHPRAPDDDATGHGRLHITTVMGPLQTYNCCMCMFVCISRGITYKPMQKVGVQNRTISNALLHCSLMYFNLIIAKSGPTSVCDSYRILYKTYGYYL